MLLSERIAEAIEGSGKTRAEISRACGVTNAAVTHWLNGDTANLKADKALALEVATGYRAQWNLWLIMGAVFVVEMVGLFIFELIKH